MTRRPFEYAILRAVPRVDRGEFVNVGVMLYCQADDYLSARSHVDPERLRALDPDADVAAIEAALAAVEAACSGDPSAGPAGEGPPGARFRWLAAPRSTVVQAGPVHSGLTADPARELAHLLARLVH
ncbi:MAG TPA: DUF3037 domain-containing protein [Euzebyales bacterium]|nr:DUF3037 domain-containing protein [Euzebyales bacterium]